MEEEIAWLERKVRKLNLSLCLEKKQTREWELQHLKNQYQRQQRPRIKSHRRQHSRLKFTKNSELQDYETQQRRSSFSVDLIKYAKFGYSVLEPEDIPSCVNNHTRKPNKLSEDLIKCLIGIFLDLNQPFPDSEEGSDISQKQISCMNSKSFISKTSFTCTAPAFFFHNNGSDFDPYSILLDFDGAVRDIGPYKTFTQITRSTLDHTRVSECSIEIGKLR